MVHGRIDDGLRMFDAHAQCEVLALDPYPLRVQALEHVARGMSCGQHHRIRAVGGPIRSAYATDPAVLHLEVVHPTTEVHLTTRCDDRLAHRGDDEWQFVGTDMRMRVHLDVRRRTEMHQRAQDRCDITAFVAPRVQFAVTVGARTTFAEAVVAVAIHYMLAVDDGKITPARPHVLATFQDDRA